MTFNIDSDGQRCDVARCGFHVHRQCRGVAAKALRADAEGVDAGEHFLLECGQLRIGAVLIEAPQQRFFSDLRRQLESAADAHADDYRRAGVAAGQPDGFGYKVYHAAAAVCGGEHLHEAHVLAAAPLRHESYGQFVAADRLASELMGVDYEYLPYIQWCARAGIGTDDLNDTVYHGPNYKPYIKNYRLNANADNETELIRELKEKLPS